MPSAGCQREGSPVRHCHRNLQLQVPLLSDFTLGSGCLFEAAKRRRHLERLAVQQIFNGQDLHLWEVAPDGRVVDSGYIAAMSPRAWVIAIFRDLGTSPSDDEVRLSYPLI